MEKDNNKKTTTAITSDDILLAALKLFAAKGYFNTSLTDIKNVIGASSPHAIHTHFKTKQEIASALYQKILDSLSCSIDDIRRRNRKTSEQLREIVDLLFSLADEAPEIIQFLFGLRLTEILPEQKSLLQTAPFDKIKKILQAGIKAGEVRNIDASLAYAHFFGVIQQTLQLILLGELDKKAEHYQSQTWINAWNTIAKDK